ncbi:hypothetical protein BB560_004175 [Smittium megazygosporum]|uniref:PB1 domain-containing protein n=1 Tax=Smittium megazygosporum TaxID=133381 RepID=A0A2T9Z9Y4_9FUNG|nr:hypothetical protein BB560_004175 [Smittium megazygosporum]
MLKTVPTLSTFLLEWPIRESAIVANEENGLFSVELEKWNLAVEAYDRGEFDLALDIFMTIADSAKYHFNIGLIFSNKGNHVEAIKAYTQAINLDQYFAVAYFQKGVSDMILKNNAQALEDFNDALLYLRGNDCIDYFQLGINYKLYACEILYNRALCYFCLSDETSAIKDLKDAVKLKSKDRHKWISKALESSGVDCPLYCVPKGILYRPPADKLKGTAKIDYLGNSKVINAVDGTDPSKTYKSNFENNANKQESGLGRSVSTRKKFNDNGSQGNISRNNSGTNHPVKNHHNEDSYKDSSSNHHNRIPETANSEAQQSKDNSDQSYKNSNSSRQNAREPSPNSIASENKLQNQNIAYNVNQGQMQNQHQIQISPQVPSVAVANPATGSIASTTQPTPFPQPVLTPVPTSSSQLGMQFQRNMVPSPGIDDSVSNSGAPLSTPLGGGIGIRSATISVPGKMKAKFHFSNEIYNLLVPSSIDFSSLYKKIISKLANSSQEISAMIAQGRPLNGVIKIRYLDEDNELVLMTDDDDFELAKGYAGGDMSSSHANVVPRIELWCSL